MITKGYYYKRIFRDRRNGFTIFLLHTPEGDVKVQGEIPQYLSWQPLQLELEVNEKKPDLYNIKSIVETTEGFPAYGLHEFFKNCGLDEKDAKTLVAQFDPHENAFEGLLSNTQKLSRIFNLKKVDMLTSKANAARTARLFREELLANGIKVPYNLIEPYTALYSSQSMYHFMKYIYQEGLEWGVKVADLDKLYIKGGGELQDASRIQAIAQAELKNRADSGSTCMDLMDLKDSVSQYLYQDGGISASFVGEAVRYSNQLRIVDDKVCLIRNYMSETTIANQLKKAIGRTSQCELFTESELAKVVPELEKELKIEYAPAQKKAFNLLKHAGLSILTGGPGTGKTTTLNGLISAFEKKYPQKRVVLTAPTGRAAQRMSESTSREASTIHRLLGIGTDKRVTSLEADLIVVDEASMIDVELASALLKVVSEDALVLLVGDIDQLPSVGPGKVLLDLIDSGICPVCRLETIFRQKGESKVIVNATKINNGDSGLETDEMFIINRFSDAEKMKDSVLEVVKNSEFGLLETQVLCTSHKGKSGIEELNKALQAMLNPKAPGKRYAQYGGTEFRIGDKVITTRNNYQQDYFNGDIGIVKEITDNEVVMEVLDRQVKIPNENLKDLSLAYCISIHKSQGSEFAHAIIVLPSEPAIMLKRNLLYTAVTRAKKKCTLMADADGETIRKCCLTKDINKRKTMLPELLKTGN